MHESWAFKTCKIGVLMRFLCLNKHHNQKYLGGEKGLFQLMLPGNTSLLRRSKIGVEANQKIMLLTGLLPMAYLTCFLIQHNIVCQVVTVPTDTDSPIGI